MSLHGALVGEHVARVVGSTDCAALFGIILLPLTQRVVCPVRRVPPAITGVLETMFVAQPAFIVVPSGHRDASLGTREGVTMSRVGDTGRLVNETHR